MNNMQNTPIKTVEPNTIKTTCAYCGVGCGITATVHDVDKRLITVQGDEQHPSNFGRLCSKGTALADTLTLDDRLLSPMYKGEKISWDRAIKETADQFNTIIQQHGPDAVAFYISGQLLTEDYYVANKLMKGFIGSSNIDTNSRLCMASPTVAHKRAFGSDTVPGCYDDFDHAELIVLTGSNTAWCHPIIFQRIKKAKENNPALKVVVIDPRETETCAIADLHLPIQSGTDAFLFNGLLAQLSKAQKLDLDYIDQNVEGFVDTLSSAIESASDIRNVADICGLSEADIHTFYEWFSGTNKVISAYSQGINQSSSGTDKVNAIINVHLATGRIGKIGAGPFSLTGQPNAMGGREVGGLANQLAAHMDFTEDNINRLSRFWQSDVVSSSPGLKAVDLFDAIEDGRVKAVWIMATSPVDSLPNANKVKTALEKCQFVAVSDCMQHTDTTQYAHMLLPALGWGEKDGTVTNSERRISRQRAVLPAPGEAKSDWWIITQVAKAMGFEKSFPYQSAHEIFKEHTQLSAFENTLDIDDSTLTKRDFNLSALTTLNQQQYHKLTPIQWPVTSESPKGTTRMFEDGYYFTPSGKAQMITVVPRQPKAPLSKEYPLILNTGRIRDQWHTMSRTALAPQLNNHKAEPFVELHPADATRHNIADGELVLASTAYGEMIARADVNKGQKPGHIFIPMHWTEQLSSKGRVGALVNPATDPLSGQPESKHTPAMVKPYQPQWYGFLLSRRALPIENVQYVVKIRGQKFYRYELAAETMIDDLSAWARALLCDNEKAAAEWVEYSDIKQRKYRGARFVGDMLESCLFISPSLDLPTRGWLAELFNKSSIELDERMAMLSGSPPAGREDCGKTICACFGVGENTIKSAISERGLSSVQAIGECLNAGTNCGSCIPELEKLLPC
ncbi:nitrate reductase [Alkalimarinus sediminis]|uniref:Molybdopterin-dependent oxidoreductase n=1 Tax=Alkalimarinus sediminis TaxID=1632866 RepID=A0A9E8HGG6_9ALTE|nr:nitrate reductase [Alkalimarinus sediminis]UZW73780.1 molybdopterin-dependent oxidoreductase [Alkalimarinus sediminis]